MPEGIVGFWLAPQASAMAQAPAGGYTSLAKVIFMLVLVTPWLAACPWVSRDAKRVRTQQGLRSGVVLGAGALGLLIWLLSPVYLVGMAMYVVVTAAGLLSYVVHRNGRVESEQRILTAAHLKSLFSRQEKVQVKPVTKLKVYSSDGAIMMQPPAAAPQSETEAYNVVQSFLYDMAWHRASEADVAPAGTHSRVRYVIDGTAEERAPLSLADSELLIQALKTLGGMNAEDRRRPQQGRISIDLAGGATDVVLATTGTTGGQRMQFRVVQQIIQTHLNELGMDQQMLEKVRQMNGAGAGMIIVSGRPGSGVTSTLYSLLREHDAFMKQLVTLEASVAADLENITQNTYRDEGALAAALASSLRRDPDVLMVDQCSDSRAAALLMEASAGKPVLLGMRAQDAFVALAKWVKLCGQARPAVANLRGVLCQMLVRKLCPTCREPYRPDPEMLAKANLRSLGIERMFRPPTSPRVDEKGRPIICHTCQGSGYFGRTAAFELLEVTDELRSLIAEGAPLAQIKASCRKNRMLYLQEQALRKVVEGVTSIQEVIRVSGQGREQSAH